MIRKTYPVQTPMDRPARAHLLDEVRGVCILLMVVYHALYDLIAIFGVDIPDWVWTVLPAFQPFVAGVFILISGIVCRYSRSNLRRGCIALGFGCVVTLVTVLVMPSQVIWFGILHFLGTAMILFGLLHGALDKLSAPVGIALCVAAYLLTMNVPQGWFGLSGFGVTLPAISSPLLLPFGFGGRGADYFPLLPWIFVFFGGAYLGKYIVVGKVPQTVYRLHLHWLAAVGRRTLLIYVLHQPVVFGLLWLFLGR